MQRPTHWSEANALKFALAIKDHYEMRDFLTDFSEGNWAEIQSVWPEFSAFCLTGLSLNFYRKEQTNET